MHAKQFLVSTALCLSLILGAAMAAHAATLENRPPGEFSLLLGLHVADEDLVAANTGPSLSPLFGARWAVKLAPRWNWFFDGVYTSVDNATDNGTNVWEGRTGFERLFPWGDDKHWFISGSLGGADVNFPTPPGGDGPWRWRARIMRSSVPPSSRQSASR